MDKKDQAIAKLYKLAKKQQELLKRAQALPAAHLAPKMHGGESEEKAIYNRLDPAHRGAVMDMKVDGNVVKVKFNPGMGSDAAWNAVQNAVTEAATNNELPHANYQIQEVI